MAIKINKYCKANFWQGKRNWKSNLVISLNNNESCILIPLGQPLPGQRKVKGLIKLTFESYLFLKKRLGLLKFGSISKITIISYVEFNNC